MAKVKIDPLEAAKITEARTATDAEKFAGKTVPAPKAPVLREDGPTIEEWVLDGNEADDYPPKGCAERPSGGLTRFKASGAVGDDMLDVARAARTQAAEKPAAPVRYIVQEDRNVNVGNGQFFTFKKGHVIALAGYGADGIKRLQVQGLKLEKE